MEIKNLENAKLIIDGKDAFDNIEKGILEAKVSIRIRVFMWRDDISGRKVISLLSEKIKVNPKIKIFIEKDTFGSLVYNLQKWISFGRLGGDIFSSEPGGDFIRNKQVKFSLIGSRLLFFPKFLNENDHSKVFVFDEFKPNAKVIIGGMNIAGEYLLPQNHKSPTTGGWHDYMVLLENEIANSFISQIIKTRKGFKRNILQKVNFFISVRNKRNIRKEIKKELLSAKKSIIIEHGYITDLKIINILRRISRRGVKIKIILPLYSDGVRHANMSTIYKLLKPTFIRHRVCTNLEVYLYKGMIHAKVIVIDEEISIIGSANLTNGSFEILRETNAIFRQKDGITRELLNQLKLDLKNCKKITLENIPKYNKVLAWIQKWFI